MAINSSIRFSAAILAVVTGFAAGASGQTRPAEETPRVSSPYWGGERDPSRERPQSVVGEFPTELASEVAPARERFVALEYSLRFARSRLAREVEVRRKDLERSPEYRELQRERAAAAADYEAARSRVTARLADDVELAAAERLREQLDVQIRHAHAADTPDAEEIRSMAQLRLAYGRRVSEARVAALAEDSDVQQAQERLRDVGRRLTEVESAHRQAVRGDGSLATLRSEIEQLRIAALAAGAYYDSTVRTANLAADYAYFRVRATTRFQTRFPVRRFGGLDGLPYYGFTPFVGGTVGVVGPVETPDAAVPAARSGNVGFTPRSDGRPAFTPSATPRPRE